jgi:hypothetical protein
MAKFANGVWSVLQEKTDFPVDGQDPNENADNAKKNQFNAILNQWSKRLANKSQNSKSGKYLKFRNNIDQLTQNTLAELQGGDFVLSDGKSLLDEKLLNKIQNGGREEYKKFYTETRISPWDSEKQGIKPPVGEFDSKYYLDTYGEDLKRKFDEAVANDDVDILGRYGTLENYAYNDYSVSGREAGNRGNAAVATDITNKYQESFKDLTDAEKAFIRDKQLGLTGKDEAGNLSVNFAEGQTGNIQDLVSEGFFGTEREDLERFRGLASLTLTDTINKLNEQKKLEQELDLFKGLPGFGEIANINETLTNSLLGDSGIGPILSIGGANLNATSDDLQDQLQAATGINLNSANYNWQKFLDEDIIGKIQGLNEITTEDGRKLTLDDEFKQKFIDDYIKPRFDQSKSITEFTQYIDVRPEEENIFQTETTLNDLQELASLRTSEFYSGLESSGAANTFDGNFYFDPGGVSGGEGSVEAGKYNRYKEQADLVNKDWEMAKKNGNLKPILPSGVENNYTWNELAYLYGLDINDKEQFAKLHYQIKGSLPEFQFDPAKDVVTGKDVKLFVSDTLIPTLQEQKADFGGGPFKEFVSPQEFAGSLLEGLDPIKDQEGYQEALKEFGLDPDTGIGELEDFISSALQVNEAERIRAGIKKLNEQKLKPTQARLGVDYIERDSDVVDSDVASKDPLFQIFKNAGFAGTSEEFYNEFFPGESKEDIDFATKALSGDLNISDFSDPFSALGAVGGLLGDEDANVDVFSFGGEDRDRTDQTESYFDLFEKEDNNTGGLGGGGFENSFASLFG